MHHSRKLYRSAGLTILELMVIVVIVGLLGSLALPHFLNAKDRSRVGAAEADLSTLRHALAVYAVDHANYPAAVASYDDFQKQVVDPEGNPYVTVPSGQTFRWVSYSIEHDTDYALVIQALDERGTTIKATSGGIIFE